MEWKHDTFLRAVNILVREKCQGEQQRFNDRIKDRDAITKWKAGKRPSFKVLLRITQEFGVSLDWLVTGGSGMSPPLPEAAEENIFWEFTRDILESGNIGVIKSFQEHIAYVHRQLFPTEARRASKLEESSDSLGESGDEAATGGGQ
jgi:transcriptional regulator with XRE-family HTH domain